MVANGYAEVGLRILDYFDYVGSTEYEYLSMLRLFGDANLIRLLWRRELDAFAPSLRRL